MEEDPPSADSVRDALTHSDAAATLTPEQRELLADQIEGLLEAGAGPEGVLAAIEQSEAVAHMSVEQKTMLAMDVLGGGAQPASADTSGVAAPVENLLGGGTAIERAQPPEYWDQVKTDYLKSPNAPEDATEWRQEADAAVARAVQEFREQGYSPGALAAAERTLREAVGSGQSEQEQSNIARMKDLTRGQVWTDTGEGYEQTDPDADVQIGIDAQGNVVGSTTSRPVPDTEWDRFLASEEARLLAENAARRAGDPNNPIDQRAAAFRELKDVAGPEGFSSAEFEAFAATGRLPDRLRPDTVLAGGGAMPADTATFLGVGGDLTPGVISPGEARAMGRPDLAGYTKEVGADGQVVAVPPEGGYDPQAAAAAEAAQSWAADASALLESQGIDTSEMTDAQMAALVDPVVASAQRQHQRDVATWAADASALLESQGIDTSEMTDAQMAALVDPVAASAQRQHQRDVATWAADASALLESQGIDTSEMTDAQMAALVR